jgi:hypothetical protein
MTGTPDPKIAYCATNFPSTISTVSWPPANIPDRMPQLYASVDVATSQFETTVAVGDDLHFIVNPTGDCAEHLHPRPFQSAFDGQVDVVTRLDDSIVDPDTQPCRAQLLRKVPCSGQVLRAAAQESVATPGSSRRARHLARYCQLSLLSFA